MRKLIDISGKKFNSLTAIKYIGKERGCSIWEFKCDCGNTVKLNGANVRNNRTKSCGCLQNKKPSHLIHGLSKTTTHNIWCGIKQRCLNPSCPEYRYYGGRGIKICDRWLKFENFLSDMGITPNGFTIERINVNGNYTPENCKWIEQKEQTRNRRNTIFQEYNGIVKPLGEWAQETGIPYKVLFYRRKMGDTGDRLFRPLRTKNKSAS